MSLLNILTAFSNYTRPGPPRSDPDIADLRYMRVDGAPFETEGVIPSGAALVLVLVEPRLFATLPGTSPGAQTLAQRLLQYRDDLQSEGFVARLIEARVYGTQPGQTQHRDGRTVLAIRDFLRAVKTQYAQLRAVILVGSFPEALWVDQSPWVHSAFDGDMIRGRVVSGRRVLSIVPGIGAYRTDIVLADLNGHWETLYHEERTTLRSLKVLMEDPPIATVGNGSRITAPEANWEITEPDFVDFFHTMDADMTWPTNIHNGRLDIQLVNWRSHPESGETTALSNPIAIPDIHVSRINARHIALVPSGAVHDAAGNQVIGGDGLPTAILPSAPPPDQNAFWVRDPSFERKLLVEYFDRNHAYRRGAWDEEPLRFGVTAFAFGTDRLAGLLRNTTPGIAQDGREVSSIAQFAQSLRRPMALRGLDAHGGNQAIALGPSTADELAAACGGRPHWWTFENEVLFPRFNEQEIGLHFWTLRTAYAYSRNTTGPCFYLATSCEINAPAFSDLVPYNAEGATPYGMFQMAESLMFFGNGLAVMSRSKVFNDAPDGFCEAFGSGRFGDGWARTFALSSGRRLAIENAADEKIVYSWGMIGDATLQLRAGHGISSRVAAATGDPTGFDDPSRGVRVIYPGARQIHELYRLNGGTWGYGDPGQTTRREGISPDGRPSGLVTDAGSTVRLLYRTEGRRIGELALRGSDWYYGIPLPAAPLAAGDPVAYVDGTVIRVPYVADDGGVRELYLTAGASAWQIGTLSRDTGAPPARPAISACVELVDAAGSTTSRACVVFAGSDGSLHALRILDGGWRHQELTMASGAPPIPADAKPFVYFWDGHLRVLYRGADKHVHEVAASGNTGATLISRLNRTAVRGRRRPARHRRRRRGGGARLSSHARRRDRRNRLSPSRALVRCRLERVNRCAARGWQSVCHPHAAGRKNLGARRIPGSARDDSRARPAALRRVERDPDRGQRGLKRRAGGCGRLPLPRFRNHLRSNE